MTTEQRIKRLDEIRNTEPVMTKLIWYKGLRKPLKVYEIPLEYLTYNPYNGRIMSMTKSFEKEFGKLDISNVKHVEVIESFLWDSAPNSNQHTLKSLRDYGQNEVGIVTRDGVIIDGNRRASLLNILNRENDDKIPFLAIILDETLESDQAAISQLETIYQIGVDDKVDYNAIEKYLKCDELNKFYSLEHIANLMSETISKIRTYLDILKLMDEYLSYIGCEGLYTRLAKKEGHFVDLNSYLNSYNKPSTQQQLVDWIFTDEDIEDLKKIYFDYIRLGIPVSNARIIARPNNKNSLFCHSSIWKEFKVRHSTILNSYSEPTSEEFISQNKGSDREATLDVRDKQWSDKLGPLLLDGLDYSSRVLEDKKKSGGPIILLERAKSTLNQIDTNHIQDKDKESLIRLIGEIRNRLDDIEGYISGNI